MCRYWPFPLCLCTDDPQCGCVRTWVGGPLANCDCSHKPEHIEPLGALQSWPRSHDLFTPHVDTRHCTHAPATAHLGPELFPGLSQRGCGRLWALPVGHPDASTPGHKLWLTCCPKFVFHSPRDWGPGVVWANQGAADTPSPGRRSPSKSLLAWVLEPSSHPCTLPAQVNHSL